MSHTARGDSSFFTRSLSELAPTAFSFSSALTACDDLSNTTQWCPFLMSRSTMLAPILPSPIMPSCIKSPILTNRDLMCCVHHCVLQGFHGRSHGFVCAKNRGSGHQYVGSCRNCHRGSGFINASIHAQLTSGMHPFDHLRDALNFCQC